MTSINTTVNGTSHAVELDGHESAVDVLREQLGLAVALDLYSLTS